LATTRRCMTRDRFYKTPHRQKTLQINFHPNFFDKVALKKNIFILKIILQSFCILKLYKVINANLNLTKLGFICKFRPKRFYKIYPRGKTRSW
jgi:hypothetical protein